MGSVASVSFYGLDTSTNCLLSRSVFRAAVSSVEQQLSSEAMQGIASAEGPALNGFPPKSARTGDLFLDLIG